jgi:Uma2 family endonuclease
MLSLGSTTFRRRDISKGLDPDECYYFRDEAKMRGRKRLNLYRNPPPELVVDVDITSRCVPREPICAALGGPEIWRFDGLKLQCLHLISGEYRERKRSLVFPFLEPAQLRRFVDELMQKDDTAIIRGFLAWVRKNGWTSN